VIGDFRDSLRGHDTARSTSRAASCQRSVVTNGIGTAGIAPLPYNADRHSRNRLRQ
jgi:hypothetical protein